MTIPSKAVFSLPTRGTIQLSATPRKKKPDPAEDQNRQLVDNAIQEGKRLAEGRLEMAKLFVSRGQTDIARRRLTELIEQHPETDEANEAKGLLKGMGRSHG